MSARTRSYLLLIITVVLWAASGPVAKAVIGYLSPSIVLTFRFGLIALILGILYQPKFPKKHAIAIIFLGLFGTIGQIGLIYWGLQYTTSIDATLLVSISPIFVAVLSHIFTHEQISKNKLFGIVLGIVGTAVIVAQPLSGSHFGNALILASNLCWAIYVVLSKKLLKISISPKELTFWTFLLGFIFMGVLSAVMQPQALAAAIYSPLKVFGMIAFLAIGPGAIAYICYETALKVVKPTDADLFNYLAPLIATPIAVFWLNEPLQLSFIIGAAIIAVGVIIAEFFPSRHRR